MLSITDYCGKTNANGYKDVIHVDVARGTKHKPVGTIYPLLLKPMVNGCQQSRRFCTMDHVHQVIK